MQAARQLIIFLGICFHRIAGKRAIRMTYSDFLYLQDIEKSIDVMHKRDSRKAGHHLRSAFGKFEKGFCENDLIFLLWMVGSMRLLVRNDFDQGASMLQHNIDQPAAIKLAAHCPFRLFVEILARTELCFFEWLIRNAIGLVGKQPILSSFLPLGSWTLSVLTELGPAEKIQRICPNSSAIPSANTSTILNRHMHLQNLVLFTPFLYQATACSILCSCFTIGSVVFIR